MTGKSLWEYIKSDLSKIVGGVPSYVDFLKWYFIPRGHLFPYMVWFRIVWWNKKKNKIINKILLLPSYMIFRHFEFKYGVHVNTNIPVGYGLFICHGDGVYLNVSEIGNDVKVYQGVTLGTDSNHGIPKVLNDVTIYPNAVVVGNITLHNGSVIAANSFVNKDVYDNQVVGGAPAHILK